MKRRLERRTFIRTSALVLPTAGILGSEVRSLLGSPPVSADVHDGFPSQPPELVSETVGVSHGNFDRLRELVDATPTLSRASWDWGFGDWESALGAASHMGRRDIAEYLLSRGARPNLFSSAMLGQIAVVRALVEASPGIQGTSGPHGITLLSHARAGGKEAKQVVEYLESVGGADERLESAPLSEEAKLLYLGQYSFGPGGQNILAIKEGRNGLALSRGNGTGRPLAFRGNHTFSPFSSPRVEIVFEVEDGKAVALLIDSAEVQVAARRI